MRERERERRTRAATRDGGRWKELEEGRKRITCNLAWKGGRARALGREGDTQGRHDGVWIPIDAIARLERCLSERIDNVPSLVEVSPSPEQQQLQNRTPTVGTCPCDVRHHEGWKLERVSLQKWGRKQCMSDN